MNQRDKPDGLKKYNNFSPHGHLAAVFMLSLISFALVKLFPAWLYRTMDVASYLVFHNIAEFFSVLVSLSIFGVGWFTYDQSKNRHTLFLSCAFLAIGLIDFMHTLSFPGMPAFFSPNSTTKAIQFWLFARLFSAGALLASAFIYANDNGRWMRKYNLLAVALVFSALVFCGVIYYPTSLPPVFVKGTGLTPLKIQIEYSIIGIFILTFAAYWRRYRKTGDRLILYYLAALIFGIFSELAFTLYKSAFDTNNMLGHVFKILAFSMIYKGVFTATVKFPYLKEVSTGEALHRESQDRQKANKLLSKSEERFRDLVETTTDWVWEIDTKGVYTYVSPVVRSLLGYEPEEMIGKSPFNFMPSDEAQRVSAIFRSHAAQHKPIFLLENITLHKDGHQVILETSGVAFLGLNGTFLGYRGIDRDVTERKKVNEALRLSEDKFAKTFHNSPDAIALTSLPDGHFVEVNERFLALSGYQLNEIIGRNTIDLDLWVNQATQQRYLNVLRTQRRVLNLEADFYKKSGKIMPCKISGEVIELKNGNFILNVIQDISESKKAEAEILRINKELRAVNRIIMSSANSMDVDEIVNKVIDEALLITGLEGGTICLVTPEQTLQIIAHRETSQATIEDLTTHTIRVGDCLCGECARDHKPLILPDRAAVLKFSTREATRGEDIRFHAAFPLVSAKRCLGVLCIFTHTDAKPTPHNLKLLETVSAHIAMAIDNAQLYAERVHQALTLRDTVRKRTAELDEAQQALLNLVEDLNSSNAKLKELDQLKSMFIASMSHELRTPLNSVIGFSSILLNKWQGPLNEEQEKNLAIILRAGKHLLALINDVIDISKIEAGALPSEQETFQLEDLLAEAVDSVLPDAQDKGLTIELHSCPAEMHSDRRRLLQSVLNLLSNAIKFSHQGSIIVTAQCNGEVVITVSDSGIGISSADLPTLFQAFVRLSPPGQATYPGTGLGLYLTRKLVTEILGGTVGATSEEGKGSSFSVTIPKQIAGEKEGGA